MLRERLTTKRGMSSTKCQAFFKTFCLLHRTGWEQPPKGFKNRDLNPWRFSRRLSATLRPLLAFGENDSDEVLYGAGSLRQGLGLLIGRAEDGQFPLDFFTSNEMKKYIGSVNHQRGHAFAEAVADELRENGWEAENEVQMTALGAKKELGDLDVLSWSPTGQVLLIGHLFLVRLTDVGWTQEADPSASSTDDDHVLVGMRFFLAAVVRGLFCRLFRPLPTPFRGIDNEPRLLVAVQQAGAKLNAVSLRQHAQVIEGIAEDRQQPVNPKVRPLLTQAEEFAHENLQGICFEIDENEQ